MFAAVLPDPPELPKRPVSATDDAELKEAQRTGLAYVLPSALAGPIIGLTLLGAWVDSRWKTGPWGVLIGALLGSVSGLINMVRLSDRLNR
jgi:F0F1-type ATP synthase assembly protein I